MLVSSGEKQQEGMSDFEQAFGAPGGQAAAPNGQPDQAANMDPAQASAGMFKGKANKSKKKQKKHNFLLKFVLLIFKLLYFYELFSFLKSNRKCLEWYLQEARCKCLQCQE